MRIAFLTLFIISNLYTNAQNSSTISGNVSNEAGPMEFVTVLLTQAQDSSLVQGQITNAQGLFNFSVIPQGRYRVISHFVGFKKNISEIISLTDDQQKVNLSIKLEEDAALLQEVTVRSQKTLVEQQNDKLVFNVQNSIIANGGNALELLGRAPGVSVDQNDLISINGKAGVTVMIDGKTSYLSSAELANFLRSLNSNTIATIEVITNPSARYDAAGNSGIVNIKLKKNTLAGWNGTVSTGTGYGRFGKATTSLNLNYRVKKWNVYTNYNYNYNKRFISVDIDRTITNSIHTAYFDQHNYQPATLPTQSLQTGVDFQWNERNSLGLTLSGNLSKRRINTSNITNISLEPLEKIDSAITVTNNMLVNWSNKTASLNYRHTFKQPGREFYFDIDYSDYNFQQNDNITALSHIDEILDNQYFLRSDVPSSVSIRSVKTDYIHPLSKAVTIEAGAKASEVTTQNTVFYELNRNNGWATDYSRTNDFDYDEMIKAAYANVKAKLKNLDIQGGVRVEQTQYKGTSVYSQKTIQRDYTNIFPGLSVTRSFSSNYSASLSYSKRIDRPAYNDLYPFIFFLDPFASAQGNPFLQPQFTNIIRLSQTIAKDFIIALSYSNTSQFMANVIKQNNETYTGYSTRENFDHLINYNINIVAPIRIHKNWSINTNTSIFYNKYNTLFLDAQYRVNKVSGLVNVTNSITLPASLSGEVSLIYHAPTVVGIFQRQALGSVNVGLQRSFLNKKLIASLNATDLFKTNRYLNKIYYQNLNMKIGQRFESRVIRINLSYNFGKNSSKASRKRTSSQEEEQRRINTN